MAANPARGTEPNYYLWWNMYAVLPIRACQCFGPLNQVGKSHRSAVGAICSVIMREPTWMSGRVRDGRG